MTWLALLGLVYFGGAVFPALIAHKGLSFERIIELSYLLTDQGIFGSLMGTSDLFIFILYGNSLLTGVGQFFIDFARALLVEPEGCSKNLHTECRTLVR